MFPASQLIHVTSHLHTLLNILLNAANILSHILLNKLWANLCNTKNYQDDLKMQTEKHLAREHQRLVWPQFLRVASGSRRQAGVGTPRVITRGASVTTHDYGIDVAT